MRTILYIIAIALMLAWGILFFIYEVGSIVHILIFLALVSLIPNIYDHTYFSKSKKQ